MKKNKPNIAVLASGSGTNFQAIAQAVRRGQIKANLKLLITDNFDAYARVRAKKLKILDVFVNPEDYSNREQFDLAVVNLLKKEKINFVILAGFMRIISPAFVNAYKNKIINIHPSLLPSFKGIDAIKRAYQWGCKIMGVTVHLVDEKIDHGRIILQEAIKITSDMSLSKVETIIHDLEHKLYPRAINLFIEGKISRMKGIKQ